MISIDISFSTGVAKVSPTHGAMHMRTTKVLLNGYLAVRTPANEFRLLLPLTLEVVFSRCTPIKYGVTLIATLLTNLDLTINALIIISF